MVKRILALAAFIFTLLFTAPLVLSQAGNHSDNPVLKLHRGTFDIADPIQNAGETGLQEKVGDLLSILQFQGPITLGDRRALERSGVTILEYIPEFAYLVRGTKGQIDTAASLPNIYAKTDFTLADKFAPGLLRAISQGKDDLGKVQIVPWTDDRGQLIQDLRTLPFRPGRRLTRAQILQVARLDSVRWIEPVQQPILLNDRARVIMGVDTIRRKDALFGSGQIIGITDTGLDTGDINTISPDFAGRIVATHVLTITGTLADEHGHGTHVAGSAAGAGVQSGANPQQHDYASSFAGVAPEAQLAIQAFEALDDGTIIGLPKDYYQVFNQMYSDGARLHSNSWGDPTGPPGDPSEFGGYVYETQRTDEFIWDHPDMAIFFAAGNSGVDGDPGPLGFCVGGDGVIDPDSLVSPGTSKNVITVGASESDRSDGPFAGFPWLLLNFCYSTLPIAIDPISDNPDGMAAFSSRGPVDDGRFKPDIAAPGTNIISNRSHASGAGTLWWIYDDHYVYSGGTSMATPLTAGMGALVREWLTLQGYTNPSAALVKATMLNTTHDMAPGQYGTIDTQEIPFSRPNNVSGWGLADLSFMDPPLYYGIWMDDHGTGLNTGNTISYTHSLTQPLEVLDSTLPLRVMLVWTDPPASLSASAQLVNDLDLVVTGPGGAIYYGNGVANGDRINNVEGIVIDDPPLGNYQVAVHGFNVPIASQPYALVIAGPLAEVVQIYLPLVIKN